MKNINVIDESTVEIDGRIFKAESIETKFEVGKWYVNPDAVELTERIFRVTKIDRLDVYFDSYNGAISDFSIGSNFSNCSRPATVQEIGSHLEKICEKKYVGKKFKAMGHESCNGFIHSITGAFWYDLSGDELHSTSPENEWKQGCLDPVIYSKGKFAEIIPDLKKLPVTREEFKELLKVFIDKLDYRNGQRGTSYIYDTMIDMLNQYKF